MIPQHIVMVSPVAFDQLQQRHQSFALELAKLDYHVTYIDPIAGGGLGMSTKKRGKNLLTVKTWLPIRCSKFPKLHQIMVRAAKKMILRHHPAPEQSLLWLSEPAMAEFCNLAWKAVVYDRCDLHGHFPGQKKTLWQDYEKKIFAKADLISISHPYLSTDLETKHRPKCILAANACSADFLKTASPATGSSQRPYRLLSSGAHFDWIDCHWLRQFAQRPDVELHIAGSGRGKDFSTLIRLPGVIFHGALSHEKLALLMRSCHVGLLPFKDIALVYGVDPIKAYEYAACGLDIWAPDIKPLRDNKIIDQFITSSTDIDALLQGINLTKPGKNKIVATWPDRLKTILDRLAILQSD